MLAYKIFPLLAVSLIFRTVGNNEYSILFLDDLNMKKLMGIYSIEMFVLEKEFIVNQFEFPTLATLLWISDNDGMCLERQMVV